MKFCMECGGKVEAVNGMPPKFCPHCGHPFDSHAKVSSATSKEEENSDLGNIPDLELSSFESEDIIIKADNIIGTGSSGTKIRRKKADPEAIKLRMKSRDYIDA